MPNKFRANHLPASTCCTPLGFCFISSAAHLQKKPSPTVSMWAAENIFGMARCDILANLRWQVLYFALRISPWQRVSCNVKRRPVLWGFHRGLLIYKNWKLFGLLEMIMQKICAFCFFVEVVILFLGKKFQIYECNFIVLFKTQPKITVEENLHVN